MIVAMLLSCGSFEGFFGSVQGQTRDSYLAAYRSDWSWYYAAGLIENGIKPIIYVPSVREEGRFETDAGVDVRFLPIATWYRPIESRRWAKRMTRATRLTLYAEERLNTLAFVRPLRKALAIDSVDLLYVQEYWSGRFDHLALHLNFPIAGADHGGVPRGVLKTFKSRAFTRAAALYAQTPDECRAVNRYGGGPILQPNGCDTGFFAPDPSAERRTTILTVARLTDKQKRTSDLIRALARLPECWSLDIVGTGPDLKRLRALADAEGVAGRTRFHGFVGREAVREMVCRCGVYAMPSANEAVALAALEAMACGASVVLSRIRAFEDLVTDGASGRLVPVGDPAALAHGILDAWEHRQTRGEAAVRAVRERFDSKRLYADLALSLRRAAAGSGAA